MSKSKKPAVAHAKKPANDLLGDLMSDAAPVKPKATAASKKRPIFELNDDEARCFDEFSAANAVMKIAEGVEGATKERCKNFAKQKFLALCIESGTLLDNPQLQTAHSRAILQIKHNPHTKFVSPDGQPIHVADILKKEGFSDGTIKRIVGDDENENAPAPIIIEKQHLGLKKFTELNAGTAEQKAVAQKLMQLVKDNLTPEERKLVLEYTTDTSVDANWKSVAVGLAIAEGKGDKAKSSKALDKLLTILPPQIAMASVVYSGSLGSAIEKLQADSAKQAAVEKSIESNDGVYRAICKGNKVSLYLVKPDGETLADPILKGTKDCENPGHAEASARKWFKSSSALAEALASFKK